MPDPRLDAAVRALKQCHEERLTYYDATQALLKAGFNQAEIAQASDVYTYSEDSVPAATTQTAGDQLLAGAEVHDEAVISAKKDLEATGTRVFERNRAVRYYLILSLLPLVFVLPFFIDVLRGVGPFAESIVEHHSHQGSGFLVLYLWSAVGCLMYVYMAALLRLARSESTITKGIYVVLAVNLVLFIASTLVFKSAAFVIVGIAMLLPGLWISRRVGSLSQLEA